MADGRLSEQTGGRPPTGARPLRGRPPVKVDLDMLQAKFDRPQPEAAQSLGISLTCLKMMCRRLGIKRWPYHRKHDGCPSGDAQQAARKMLASAPASGAPAQQAAPPTAPLQRLAAMRPAVPVPLVALIPQDAAHSRSVAAGGAVGTLSQLGAPAGGAAGAEFRAPLFAGFSRPLLLRENPAAGLVQGNDSLLALIAACGVPALALGAGAALSAHGGRQQQFMTALAPPAAVAQGAQLQSAQLQVAQLLQALVSKNIPAQSASANVPSSQPTLAASVAKIGADPGSISAFVSRRRHV